MLCRACGMPIEFIANETTGKRIPINIGPVRFVPDIYGPITYVMPDGQTLRGVVPTPGDKDVHIGYVSHWSTCEHPEYFHTPRMPRKERKQ